MAIGSIDNINTMYNMQKSATNFQHKSDVAETPVAKKQETPQEARKRKLGVLACTTLGVASSLALLAKFDKSKKYSLSLKKMLSTPIKESYIGSAKYKSKEVITIGLGSSLGGLLGGKLFDKRQDNMKEKVQEGVNQILNISVPVVFVEGLVRAGEKIEGGMKDWVSKGGKLRKVAGKLPSVTGAMIGLVTGMYAGNRLAYAVNKNLLGKKEDDRPIKVSDFSAHLDDVCVAATLVAENNPVTKAVSRIVPVALGVAGYEVGNK